MSFVGKPMLPWQADILVDAHGMQDDGLWSCFELACLLARQNGKGGVTEGIELPGVFLFKEPLILHSAHQFKTSTAAFRRLQDIIDGSDWLAKRVKMISRSKGDESIQLTRAAGGGMIQFVARTLGSGRGLTGSTTVFDEAAWLTVGQYAAQTPALSTIPNPRIVYTSTPPDEDVGPMPEDAMLPSVRKRGRAGGDRVGYYEWSPEPGADPADPETHRRCNPSFGILIAPWFLAKQYDNFKAAGKPEKFITEHLGQWPPDSDEQWQIISADDWTAHHDPDGRIETGAALGIAMKEDRSVTSIAILGRRGDGKRFGQLIEYMQGSGGVVELAKIAIERGKATRRPICAVVIGANDPARSLLPDFTAAGIKVVTPGTADVAAECGAVYDGIAGEDVEARDLFHGGQAPLTAAIAGAVPKKIAKSWLWATLATGGDSSPAYALTFASYGFRVNPPSAYNALDNIW